MNSDFTQLFWAGTLIIASIVHLAYLSNKRRLVTFQDIHLLMFYFWMGGTVFVAYSFTNYGLPLFSEATVTKAYISIWLYIIGILITKLLNGSSRVMQINGSADVKVNSMTYAALNIGSIPIKLILGTLTLVIFTNITSFFVYGVGFYGAGTNEKLLLVPYPIMIVQLITNLGLVPTLFFWAWCIVFVGAPGRSLAIFIIIESFFFHLIALSRAQLIFDATLVCLAYTLTARRISLKAVAGWASVGLVIYLVVIPVLFGIRFAGQSITNTGGFQHLVDSVDAWISGRFDYAAESATKTNLASRTLIMSFNYSVVDGLETHSPMFGAALWSSIVAVIPRVFYFGATKVMYSSEGAIEIYFTGRNIDTSESWSVLGLADFGMIGGLCIGLIFGTCQAIGQRLIFATSQWSPFFAICIIGEYFNSLISIEQAPEALWGSWRDLSLIFLTLCAVGYFMRISANNVAPEIALERVGS